MEIEPCLPFPTKTDNSTLNLFGFNSLHEKREKAFLNLSNQNLLLLL